MKNILIIPCDGDKESFEVKIKKISNGINDYLIDDKYWRAFQYDCRDRPKDYIKERVKEVKFHGYLISRVKKGNVETIECLMQIID